MEIRPATTRDLPELRAFYDFMCSELGNASFLPEGNKGGFPSDQMLEAAIAGTNQFVGIEDGKIVAAYIVDNNADEAYDHAPWHVDATRDQAYVLHALRVHPAYGGRGFAGQLVEHAIATSKSRGQKALRLDCIEGNSVPHAMYRAHGFDYVGTADITYEDIGHPRTFLLFERPL